MLSLCIRIMNTNDAALLTVKCGEYEEDIDYKCGKYVVDAKSLMGVLSVGLGNECCLTLHSDDYEVQKRFKEDMDLWWASGNEDDAYCYFGSEVASQ